MTGTDTPARPATTVGRRSIGRWIAVPALVVLALFLGVLATRDVGGDRQASSFLIGQRAPDIAGPTIADGSFDLLSTRGEFVVVNFFATWCTPCRREHPELVAFAERHAEAGDASVVSVVYDDRVTDTIEFFDRFGGDWPVVVDPDGRIALDYGVSGVPESYVVAPDGTVVSKIVGGVTADDLDRILADVEAAGGGAS